MRKTSLRLNAILLSVSLLVGSTLSVTAADAAEGQAAGSTADISTTALPYYSTALQEYQNKGYQPVYGASYEIKPESYSASAQTPELQEGIGSYSGQSLVWTEDTDWIEWQVTVETAGLYNLEMEYYPLTGTGQNIQREIAINGEMAFSEEKNLTLYRYWKDKNEPIVNYLGNEVKPGQVELNDWYTDRIYDDNGKYSEPLLFYFEAGENTIRLSYVIEPVALRSIRVVSPEEVRSYSAVKEEYRQKGYQEATETLEFEAESTVYAKSASTIYMGSDSDPSMSPANDLTVKMNMLTGWSKGGQSISWKVNVKESGLYKLVLRDNQSLHDGISSYRSIHIDGKVPYEELLAYRFVYRDRWRTETLSDQNGEPLLIYLEAGERTLTMRAVCGPLGEASNRVDEDYQRLTKLIREITMITSDTPDVNYDYELDKTIPNLISDLQDLKENLEEVYDILLRESTKKSTTANQLESTIVQLGELIDSPDNIPRRLSDLENMTNTYTSLITTLRSLSLSLDKIWLAAPDEEIADYRSTVWQKLAYTARNFVASFFKDYNSVGASDSGSVDEVIDIWISRGREWGEVIQNMIDSSFTPQTRIGVRINLLPSGQLSGSGVNTILLSISSGRAPDVAMGVDGNMPFEYGIRGAVCDLAQFDDFDEIKERFLPQLFIPHEYNGQVFAIPETMNARVIYYRTDLFEEYDIPLPDTWDDVLNKTLPALYRNGMEMYIPLLFDLFLYQRGGSYYTEDNLESALGSPEGYQAFSEMIQLYTRYGVPYTMNFLNHFRMGDAPIGIDTLSMYFQLVGAAPELAGRWTIAPIPGIQREDGTVDRSSGGFISQSDIILSQSDNQEAGWEFLKWWTSEETQTAYAQEIESRLGVESRWLSANLNSLRSLAWSRSELKVIDDSIEWARETPSVIGGYFTSRHLVNAWTRCIMSGQKVRESLEQCVEDINIELRRRQRDFGIEPSEGR